MARRAFVTALLSAALLPQWAGATMIQSGDTVTPALAVSPLLSSVLADTGPQAFFASSGGTVLSGTAEAWAVRFYPGNPFGSADITFVYQFTLDPSSTAAAASLAGTGFGSYLTDVTYALRGLGAGQVGPAAATRSPGGDTVSFAFQTPLAAGQQSTLLVVNTNATNFQTSSLAVGGPAGPAAKSYAPAAGTYATPAPEPGTLAGALLGAGAVAWAYWRRKAA